MLPEDLKAEIARGPELVGDNSDGRRTGFITRIAELAYQRGREDERMRRAAQEKANIDLAEAIEARGKE